MRPVLYLAIALASVSSSLPAVHAAEAATPHAPSGSMQLFLLIGQSNMAGRGPVEPQDKIVHPRVFMLTKELTWVPATDPMHFDKAIAGVGPGSSFARTVADSEPNAIIGLIPAAVGGTSLDQWKPGGALYTAAVTRAREAMKHGKLAGILWHQGESDSASAKAATYAARFAAMIAQLRTDLNAPEVPLIVGETGRFRADAAEINAVITTLPKTVPHCAFVSAEGLTDKGDKLHFDSASARELGRRYARAWLTMAASR